MPWISMYMNKNDPYQTYQKEKKKKRSHRNVNHFFCCLVPAQWNIDANNVNDDEFLMHKIFFFFLIIVYFHIDISLLFYSCFVCNIHGDTTYTWPHSHGNFYIFIVNWLKQWIKTWLSIRMWRSVVWKWYKYSGMREQFMAEWHSSITILKNNNQTGSVPRWQFGQDEEGKTYNSSKPPYCWPHTILSGVWYNNIVVVCMLWICRNETWNLLGALASNPSEIGWFMCSMINWICNWSGTSEQGKYFFK